MKDLVIKGSVLKRELIVFLCCVAITVILNIYSIAKFKTDWSELIGQFHVVILVSLFLYALVFLITWAVRGIFKAIRK